MKRSRFSEHQILAILQEAENGMPVKEVCRRHEISTAIKDKDTHDSKA